MSARGLRCAAASALASIALLSASHAAPVAPAPALPAVEPRALADIVDEYVREGLRANLALRRGHFDVERAIAALDAARAAYLPQVTLEARYSF